MVEPIELAAHRDGVQCFYLHYTWLFLWASRVSSSCGKIIRFYFMQHNLMSAQLLQYLLWDGEFEERCKRTPNKCVCPSTQRWSLICQYSKQKWIHSCASLLWWIIRGISFGQWRWRHVPMEMTAFSALIFHRCTEDQKKWRTQLWSNNLDFRSRKATVFFLSFLFARVHVWDITTTTTITILHQFSLASAAYLSQQLKSSNIRCSVPGNIHTITNIHTLSYGKSRQNLEGRLQNVFHWRWVPIKLCAIVALPIITYRIKEARRRRHISETICNP